MTLSKGNKLRFLVLFVTMSLMSCGGGNNEPSPADNGKDRQVILTHWVDNIVLPSYNNFKVKFDVMKTKADVFKQSPTLSALSEFRTAWVDAYLEWQKVELFEFGPADQTTLRNFYNIYPTDVAGIGENINNPSVNLDLPASYARQGFPALDYLINGVASTDDQIISFYTNATEGTKRITYLARLVDRMNTLITNVISGWTSYRETFITRLHVNDSSG